MTQQCETIEMFNLPGCRREGNSLLNYHGRRAVFNQETETGAITVGESQKTLNEAIITLSKYRAVFKWLSKVITWLRLLRLVIGLKDSRQFFNQWESNPKPIKKPCTRDFSRPSSELHVIARNCDWFIALHARVVIGRSNCFGFGFSTVISKSLYHRNWFRFELWLSRM